MKRKKMGFWIIVAVDENLGIGKNNSIPWRYKEDLKFFRETTVGSNIIMGRKTCESLPKQLPNRYHIVLSKSSKSLPYADVIVSSFQDALNVNIGVETFVIGGAEIYRLALNHRDCLGVIMTRIPGNHLCDTFFPKSFLDNFELSSSHPLTKELIVERWQKK